jgi:hypothetical protein
LFGTESEISRGVDFTKLAATQRAIANFVTIVTSKQIPVVFKSSEDSFTDGKQIVIGTDTSPNQFDSTVGLALHEGSHITHTDFKILHNFDRHVSLQGCDPDLNITDSQLMCIKNLLNWIEDRRIDMLSYQSAPGYRNYYEAMYNKEIIMKQCITNISILKLLIKHCVKVLKPKKHGMIICFILSISRILTETCLH